MNLSDLTKVILAARGLPKKKSELERFKGVTLNKWVQEAEFEKKRVEFCQATDYVEVFGEIAQRHSELAGKL